MLEKKFKTLCSNYSNNNLLIEKLWKEIKESHKNRAYHNLTHLEYIYSSLEEIKLTATIEFSIFYHDIVYNIFKNNNEENSAKLAKERLVQLSIDKETIQKVQQLIIETKTHQPSSEDNAIFLDADLAILGSSTEKYKEYSQKIRIEYAIYDDRKYKKGRIKLLKSLINRNNIYTSSYFKTNYEQKARNNLTNELMLLF